MNKETVKYLNSLVKRSIEHRSIYIDYIEYEKNKLIIEKLKDLNHLDIKEISTNQEYKVLGKNNQFVNLENMPFSNLKYKITIPHETTYLMAKKKLDKKRMKSSHDQIIYSLIRELRKENDYLFFSNFEIKTKFGISRPDLYIIQDINDLSKMNPICYEVKHSRNDFLSDIKKSDKRASYLEISPQLFYVCPYDVIKLEEVPIESGLIYMKKDGSFEIIKEAPINVNWLNNFNIDFLNTLIVHKSNENIDIFIQENINKNSNIKKEDFNNLCLKENVTLLNRNHLQILDRFITNDNQKSFKEFRFIMDCINSIYDLIGLGILQLEEKKVDDQFIFNGDNRKVKKHTFFVTTSVGKKLIEEIKKISNEAFHNFLINERNIHNKLSFFKVLIDENIFFDFYIINKTKSVDKLTMTGCIKVKNKTELDLILSQKEILNYKSQFCQKLAFVNFENNIDKKDVPRDYSLYNTNDYYFSSSYFPKHEIKRGKKRDITDINKSIFMILLREEYNNKKCFLF